MENVEKSNNNTDEVSSPKRPQFGGRLLTDPNDVFKHNAWDNVVWDEEQEEDARKQVEKNSLVKASLSDIEKFNNEAHEFWNKFYGIHDNKFFKDRNWLFTEFPELLSCSEEKKLKHQNCSEEDYPGSNAHTRILEVGCGVGNTIFPLIQTNNDNGTFVYGCDFSKTAVEIVCAHKHFNPKRCHAFVCDITNEEYNVPFPPNSLDFIILIFVLSAVNPNRKQYVIDKLVTFLKPGGKILFRDYGRYDMAQLRFKPGRCIGENFYVRGDGTQVYFFTQDEMDKLFTSAGLVKEKNVVDRRLQVNRSKLLKMYRIWIQCEYMKPIL